MKRLTVFAMILWLSACGFHLKGTQAYDRLPVQTWQISGGALQQPLEQALYQAQAKPTLHSPEAEIRVLGMDTKKDIYTITRAAKLNEYLLSMRVTAQAYRHGNAWGEPITVEVRRTLHYADSMVLGKDEEEQTIWREMRQDAAEQIVRRLAFLPDYASTTVNP